VNVNESDGVTLHALSVLQVKTCVSASALLCSPSSCSPTYKKVDIRLHGKGNYRKVDIRLHGKGNSKLPWRKAGQPSHSVDVVDSDQ
jgi:hypothetical protein